MYILWYKACHTWAGVPYLLIASEPSSIYSSTRFWWNHKSFPVAFVFPLLLLCSPLCLTEIYMPRKLVNNIRHMQNSRFAVKCTSGQPFDHLPHFMDRQHGELITYIIYIPLSPEFISQQYTLCTFSTCSVCRCSSPTMFSLMGPDLVGQVHMDTVNDFQDHPGAKQLGSHWSVCTDSRDGEIGLDLCSGTSIGVIYEYH